MQQFSSPCIDKVHSIINHMLPLPILPTFREEVRKAQKSG